MKILSGSPYRIVSRTFCGSSRHGVLGLKGICSASWRRIDLRFIIILFAPYRHALTAPARTLLVSSGTASSGAVFITRPIPPQWRHAPSGWLKEKLLTVSGWKVSPQISQESAQLRRSSRICPPVCDSDEYSATARSPPSRNASSSESATLSREAEDEVNLSTTSSTLYSFAAESDFKMRFSSAASSSSRISPPTLARCHACCLSDFSSSLTAAGLPELLGARM